MLDYQLQDKWKNGVLGLQSPINLQPEIVSSDEDLAKLVFQQPLIGKIIENSNNSFRIIGSGSIIMNQVIFKFQELHFHLPSEHLIDNHQFKMEWHLVFKNEQGQTLVIARLVKLGETNVVYQQIWDAYQVNSSEIPAIDLTSIIKVDNSCYHYQGSLTTPPLTQNVSWYIDIDPLTVSQSQLKKYHEVFATPNNRKVQPLKNRCVQFGIM